MRHDDTSIRSRVSAHISHLTQPFPPCCHGTTVNMLLTQMKRYYWVSLTGLSVSIKILAHHSYVSVSGGMCGGHETLDWSVCAWANSPDWQAIQLSGSEKERNTIIISIISHSAPFCCQTLSLLRKWALCFHCSSFICYDGPAPTWKTNALWQISKAQRLGPNTPQRSEKMPELWNKCPCRPTRCTRTRNSTWRFQSHQSHMSKGFTDLNTLFWRLPIIFHTSTQRCHLDDTRLIWVCNIRSSTPALHMLHHHSNFNHILDNNGNTSRIPIKQRLDVSS